MPHVNQNTHPMPIKIYIQSEHQLRYRLFYLRAQAAFVAGHCTEALCTPDLHTCSGAATEGQGQV